MRVLVVTLSVLTLAACQGESSLILTDLGLSDEPLKPVTLDLLTDFSEGSSGSLGNVDSTLDRVLPFVAERPGSQVRLWILGSTVGETTLIASREVEGSKKHSPKARRAYVESFSRTTRELFLTAAEAALRFRQNRSPLLESLTKIGFAGSPGGAQRVIILITDSREFSNWADFECDNPPETESFLEKLHNESVLSPGSLDGAQIYFSFTTMGEIAKGRCRLTMARSAAIRSLWKSVLTAAGASHVEFSTSTVSNLVKEDQ